MKKRVHICLYVLGMAAFAAWLALGTSVVARVCNGSRVQRIDFADYQEYLDKDTVYFSGFRSLNTQGTIDFFYSESGALEKLYVNSWALAGTKEDNSDRQVALILKGEDASYALFPANALRDDAQADLPDLIGREIDIPSRNVGFSDEFSTLSIDDGVYDLYVYCRENDTNAGMTDTMYRIVKDGEETRCVPWQSQALDEAPAVTAQEHTAGKLASASIDGEAGLISFFGWETDPDNGGEPADPVCVTITDEDGNTTRYNTRNGPRLGFDRYRETDPLAENGWNAVLPEDALTQGRSQLRVLSESGGQLKSSKNYIVYREDDALKVSAESEQAGDTIETTQPDSALCHFDSAEMTAYGDVRLQGWVFAEGKSCSGQTVYLEFTGADGSVRRYLADSVARKDVVKYYDDARYADSGWRVVLPGTALADGVYQLRLLMEKDGKVWSSEPAVLRKRWGEIGYVPLSGRADEPVRVTEEKEARRSFDGISRGGELMELWGWAFAEGEDCAGQTVYLQFEGENGSVRQYTADSAARVDVAKSFGDGRYTASGWSAVLPGTELEDGVYQLSLLIENGGKVWRSASAAVEKTADGIIMCATEKEVAACSFDSMSLEDGQLELWGWGLAEGEDCAGQRIYLEFAGEDGSVRQYIASNVAREDVARSYGEERYTNSGWSVTVPAAELRDGAYQLSLLIENGGRVWRSAPAAVKKTADGIIVCATEKEAAACSFDSVSLEDGQLVLWGWGLIEGEDCAGQRIYLEIAGADGSVRQYIASDVAREDVARSFGDGRYTASGWSVTVPAAELQDGVYRLRLLVEKDGKVWSAEPAVLRKRWDEVGYVSLDRQMEKPVRVTEEEAAACSFDGISQGGELLELWGWGLVEGEDCASQTVYLQFEGEDGNVRQYLADSRAREDVAGSRGDGRYTASGWSAVLPGTELEDGEYQLSLLIENGGRIWRSASVTIGKNEKDVTLVP